MKTTLSSSFNRLRHCRETHENRYRLSVAGLLLFIIVLLAVVTHLVQPA